MNAIETVGLTKEYNGVSVVDNLSFAVRQGELIALLGVNGAGKTTTVKMLSCLVKPTAGEAWVCGKSIIKETGEVKKCIGVCPQETAVADGLTTVENLKLMCGVHDFSGKASEERIDELISLLGLEAVRHKKAGVLSGGWQRRLSIAMAMVSQPQILFLDEPTLGLDVFVRSELWELIRSLKGKVTVVLTTHYMEEAECLSDRVAILRNGRLLQFDTPENMKTIAGSDRFEKAFIRIVKEDLQ